MNVSGIRELDILVDGNNVGKTNTVISRPDVNQAVPGYKDGVISGFKYTINSDYITPGSHLIQINAMGNDGFTQALSTRINLVKPAPIINIEGPNVNNSLHRTVEIQGWAVNASNVKKIDVYVDNNVVGQAILGVYRPDVGSIVSVK